MQRLCAVIVMGAIFGCGHTREVFLSRQMDTAPLRQVNRETRDRKVHLVLRDGRSFMAQGTRIFPDSTFWHAGDSEVAWAVMTAEISRISFKSRKKGAENGLMIGSLIGLPLGALSNFISGEKADRASAAFNGGVAGVVWGTVIGALVGSQITYVFIAQRAVQTPTGEP